LEKEMPIYEYECHACHSTIDLSRPLEHREMPVSCPLCGSDAFYKPTFSGTVIFSSKQWKGRSAVCWEADDDRTVMQKQLAAAANDTEKSKLKPAVRHKLLETVKKQEGV
jgi:putative FmdB family regulatory protein